MLPVELLTETAGSTTRGLLTYHEYMKFHANQVVQHLLPPGRRAPAVHSAAVPAGTQQRIRATSLTALEPSQVQEAASVRAPIDASSLIASQLDQTDQDTLEAMMDASAAALDNMPQLEATAAAAVAADDTEPDTQ
jgi:hypothetical protein